jgi:hypothetical protein
MGARARTAAVVAALACAAGCTETQSAEAALSPFEQLASDSLAADSAAFTSLPPSLREWLDIREHMIALPDDLAGCSELPPRHANELRLRLRFREDPRGTTVLYAVADRTTGALERVEFLRPLGDRGQRSLVWDSESDNTVSRWFSEVSRTYTRRVERGEIPRGGPVPRALRGLARQLVLLPCAPLADTASVTPETRR